MGTVKYSGPVASFHCPTNAEIRSLKVHFSPKQEGSGDPSPENVRPIVGWDGVEAYKCGKNLLKYWKNGYYSSTRGYFVSSQNNASFYPIKIKSTDVLYFSINSPVVQSAFYFFTDPFNMNNNTYLSGRQYYSSAQTGRYVKKIQPPQDCWLVFQIDYGSPRTSENAYEKKPQLEFERSVNGISLGATDYESYQDSTTDYEFGVLGKNKFNGTIVNRNIDSNGKILTTDLNRLSSLYVPVSSGTYTLSSAENYPTAVYVYKEDNDDSFIANESLITWNESPVTFAINEGKYISIKWKKEDGSSITVSDISNIQLELGSTATEYEPYDPNHTVYGGWVDLISGEVCEEYRFLHFIKDYFIAVSTINDVTCALSARINGIKSNSTFYCNHLNSPKVYSPSEMITALPYDGWILSEKRLIFVLPSEITTLEQVKDLIDDIGGLDVVYARETPNTYHVAPTQLQTFLGQNNVWSNADYIEVEYDLHETQDILARKQFIVANQPHLVSPAAAPLQNFVTDMVAPLKECKVYFSPVQEGEGDPSPDNIRAISGWNGIKLWASGKNMLPDWKSIYVNRRQNGETFNGITYSFTDNGFQLTGTATTSGRANLGGSGKENTFTENNSPILKGGYSYIISYNKTGSLLNNGSGQVENRSGWIQPGQAFELTKDGRAWLYHSLTTEEGLTYNEKIEDVQLELGSIATDYEPYNGTTIPIDWTAEAGTIYGGYVDLVTGELIATYGIVDLGTLTYTHRPDFGNGAAFSTGISTTSLRPKDRWTGVCNSYPYLGIYNNFTNATCGIGFIYNNNIIIKDINVTTNDASVMKAALNGVMLCYELAAPIAYQLTSVQLKTLRGTNNIWSNSNGDIMVQFWTH